MAAYPEGMIECGDCLGKGRVVSVFGPASDQTPCENCAGKGWIVCEHWETDCGHCLCCGESLIGDMIEAAELRLSDR